MSEWIVGRRPRQEDAVDGLVWVWFTDRRTSAEKPEDEYGLFDYMDVSEEMPWAHIARPNPYKPPKPAYRIEEGFAGWYVFANTIVPVAHHIPSEEAANEILEIYKRGRNERAKG